MKVTVNGDISLYFVQCICMNFFPGAKFSDKEEVSEETPTLHVDLMEENDTVKAVATASWDGNTVEKEYSRESDPAALDKIRKFVVGMAVNTPMQIVLRASGRCRSQARA